MKFKNKKKLNAEQQEEVGRVGVERKRKHEEQSKEKVWNDKRKKWTDPASQTGYIGPTVREMFIDMKDEPHDSKDFQACYKFVRRRIQQKEGGVFDIEGNNVKNKSQVADAGPPIRVTEIRKDLFQYFIDIHWSLKGRLPKALLSKAETNL